jgi:hypothetical protein
MQTVGGNIRYASSQVIIGLTALNYSFGGLTVNPNPQPYNRFYFRGEQNTNIGMDYSLKLRQTSLFGETALSENGALATLNAVHWSASSGIKMLILHRYYDRKYQAFYGNAFSQGSTVQNENGIYFSMQWSPFAYWRLSGYADFFRFPWLKYGVDAPSSGKEYMTQAEFTKIKKTVLSVRYRFREREKNSTDGNEAKLIPTDHHRIRFQVTHKPSARMNFRTSFETNLYKDEVVSSRRGRVISQSAGWKSANSSVQADVYVAYFNTDDYATRIFSHEKNLLYSFSIPSFSGEGVRSATVLRYNFTPDLSLSSKIAWVHYYDRELIGSGLEEIEGRDKIDLSVQLRWKF